MSCFRFTKRFLVTLFVLFTVNSANIITFPDSLETGSLSYSPPNRGSCNGGTLVLLTMTFTSDKGTDAYDPTLAFQALDLRVSDKTLSIRMRVDLKSSNSLTVVVDNFCSKVLNLITIRYLIVVPPLTSSVSLRNFDPDYSPSILLRNSRNFSLLITNVLVAANQTSTALFLRGFNISNSAYSNFLDIYAKEILTDTTLTVNITTVNSNDETYLSQISLTVIMVNQQITLKNITSTFELHSIDFYKSGITNRYTYSNTIFGNHTTFIGIRSFKNFAFDNVLDFYFTINNSSTFQVNTGVNSNPNQFSFDIINFVFKEQTCNSSAYLLAANDTCYATCPSPYFNNDTSKTCDLCSSNCSSCEKSPSNCTACSNTSYLNDSTCITCPSQCVSCSAPTNCSTCIDHYVQVNQSCVVNCSSIANCSFCTLNSEVPYCLNCSSGFSASYGRCNTVCGDGKILGSESCDDGNSNDGDGCSQCTVQQYFICDSSNGTNSTCNLNQLSLSYSYSLKVTDSNAFISYYSIQPKISALSTLNWMAGVSTLNANINVTGCSYDSSKGLLAVVCSYSDDVSFPVSLSFQFANISNITKNISAATFTSFIMTENNLGLQYYSSSTYSLSVFVKYFAILISCASILMFLAGYFGGKLIAVQHLAVLQVTFLSVGTVQNASPLFDALRCLKLSVGNTMLGDYNYSTSISRDLKGWYFSPSLLDSYNIALGLTVLPVLIAGFIKLLSLTAYKASRNLPKIWAIVFCEITFYGLILSAYMVFSQLSFQFLMLADGKSPGYVDLAVVFGQSLLLFFYCYYLNQVPTYFGDFKKKFEKFNICSYYYSFIVFERLLVSMMVFFLRNFSFGLIIVFLVIVSQLIFVAQRKPYSCGGSTRPVINLLATALIVFLVFLCNFLSSVSVLQTFVPIVICLILGIILGSSSYFFVIQLKEIYDSHESVLQDDREIKSGNETSTIIKKFFNISEPENVNQKNRAQFEIFKQKLILDADEVTFAPKQTIEINDEEAFEREKLNYEWDNYHVVANRLPIFQQMRLNVRTKHILDSIQPIAEQ